MTPQERAKHFLGDQPEALIQALAQVLREAMMEEREACIAIINEAREEGESDLRQVREWIRSREP